MAERKKVLLLTYYWPPAGGAGVQRWLKMSKYIANYCRLTVYHPENADYPILDESLRKEIPENITTVSKRIIEPYRLASYFSVKNKNYQKGQIEPAEKQNLTSKISLWIRANQFIPDARYWWIMPSFRFLNKYLEENPQDIIITTGPPHSVHLTGLRLKLRHPELKWIADFRDPWTAIDYFDKLPMTAAARKKNEKLEKQVLKYADVITTVSESWAEDLGKIAAKNVEVIYNGYDRADFRKSVPPDEKFVITYAGSLNDDRNPSLLWKILNDMCADKEFATELEVRLIGNISSHVKSEIREFEHLFRKTFFTGYLSHHEVTEELQKSQILLLLINETPNEKGIIPGKLFEYMAAGRRILCLGRKDADIAGIISQTSSGVMLDRYDENKIRETLEVWFKNYCSHLLNQSLKHNTSQYSRKNAAFDFINLIENI